MSSHHFVKDGQEPALVVANGKECSYSLLTSLLEWCPYVVACDGAYDRLIKLQIEPSLVIGDFDSIGEKQQSLTTEFVKLNNQNTTDLEKAIDHLVDKGYSDINVIWATGNRLDHTINNFTLLKKYSSINLVFFDDFSKSFVLPKEFAKVYSMGDALSLVPISRAEKISTSNLLYPLNNETLELGVRSGTSNSVVVNGEVSISHSSGTLVLVEAKDYRL